MEWEGLTNRLRAEIDELNNDKEKLLTDNKDLNSQLSENETSKELKERLESLDVENKLVKEQLNARETQLTSLQACSYFQKILTTRWYEFVCSFQGTTLVIPT